MKVVSNKRTLFLNEGGKIPIENLDVDLWEPLYTIKGYGEQLWRIQKTEERFLTEEEWRFLVGNDGIIPYHLGPMKGVVVHLRKQLQPAVDYYAWEFIK